MPSRFTNHRYSAFLVKRFVMPAWMTLGKKRARLALQGLWGCWWRETGPRPRLWPAGGGCGLCPAVMLELFLVVLLPASPSGVKTACMGLLLLLPPLLFYSRAHRVGEDGRRTRQDARWQHPFCRN